MMVASAQGPEMRSIAAISAAGIVAEGSAAHPYPQNPSLLAGSHARRNLADGAHYLGMLHGRHPGIVDLAAERASADARGWMAEAAAAFAEERGWLTRLVAAAGPLPSTAHQAESEAAVAGQRHALEMLARSERDGCALGGAVALLADWRTIRLVLDVAADRFGLAAQPYRLPRAAAIDAFLALTGGAPAFDRALRFGAQQLLVQHRALWDLLEAREQARRLG